MALEPITRQEKIIAGQDLTPITRMEKFLKEYGGGGSGLPSGGAPYQHLVTDGEGNAKWEDRAIYVNIHSVLTGASHTYTCDTAYETIYNALYDGIPVMVFLTVTGNCFTAAHVFYDANNYCIEFKFVTLTGPATVGFFSVYCNSDGEIYDTIE